MPKIEIEERNRKWAGLTCQRRENIYSTYAFHALGSIVRFGLDDGETDVQWALQIRFWCGVWTVQIQKVFVPYLFVTLALSSTIK